MAGRVDREVLNEWLTVTFATMRGRYPPNIKDTGFYSWWRSTYYMAVILWTCSLPGCCCCQATLSTQGTWISQHLQRKATYIVLTTHQEHFLQHSPSMQGTVFHPTSGWNRSYTPSTWAAFCSCATWSTAQTHAAITREQVTKFKPCPPWDQGSKAWSPCQVCSLASWWKVAGTSEPTLLCEASIWGLESLIRTSACIRGHLWLVVINRGQSITSPAQ